MTAQTEQSRKNAVKTDDRANRDWTRNGQFPRRASVESAPIPDHSRCVACYHDRSSVRIYQQQL